MEDNAFTPMSSAQHTDSESQMPAALGETTRHLVQNPYWVWSGGSAWNDSYNPVRSVSNGDGNPGGQLYNGFHGLSATTADDYTFSTLPTPSNIAPQAENQYSYNDFQDSSATGTVYSTTAFSSASDTTVQTLNPLPPTAFIQRPGPHLSNDAQSSISVNVSQAVQAPAGHPHQCDHCPKSFKRNCDLRRHYKKHFDSQRAFHCYVNGCHMNGQKGFYRKDKFADHQRNMHGI